jgi:predicted RNase H-like nuclease (RuvC/YqgF family)
MSKNEAEYSNISEDNYKTLISVYQQKTFEIFNQNIALEAKVVTLGSIIESLNETIENITKEKDKLSKNSTTSTGKRAKIQNTEPTNSEWESEETFD